MNFGHYSCITKEDLKTISSKKSLWGCYSAKKSSQEDWIIFLALGAKDMFGPSKMSFIKLVVHAFSILAVFKYQVLFRSCLLFAVIFLFVPGLYGVLFEFFVSNFYYMCFFCFYERE